ncbi:MAG: lamin tail domain-containing protein [Candidatus Woesebacteria bacterium]|jgi:hypothetical protein
MNKNFELADLIIILFLLLIFLFFFPILVQAQLVINEVYPQPDSGQEEWVELYLPTEQEGADPLETLSLQGWTLWDELASPSIIYSFNSESISPGEYLLISLSSKLNNSGDAVILKNQDNELVDQMSYQNSQKNYSFARIPNAEGDFQLSLATPGEENHSPSPTTSISSTPEPSLSPSANPSPQASPTGMNPSLTVSPSPSILPTPTNIPTPSATSTPSPAFNLQLSEIMACPSEGKEWIEIYNPNQQAIALNQWSIWDEKNLIFNFSDEIINALSFFTIELYNKLNNDGDQVILKDPKLEVEDFFEFADCNKDHSYIFFAGSWLESSQTTRGTPNVYLSPTPSINNDSESDEEITIDDLSLEQNQELFSDPNPLKEQSLVNQFVQKNENLLSQFNSLALGYSIDLSKLNLDLKKNNSYSSHFGKLYFTKQTKKKTYIISVIIGGSIFLFVALINLYEGFFTIN